MVAQIFTSWNPLTSWIRLIEHFRKAASMSTAETELDPALATYPYLTSGVNDQRCGEDGERERFHGGASAG
jgi:hypothetical protein